MNTINTTNAPTEHNGPILRLRHIPLVALALGVLIAGPLSIVWKQVYINELSMKKKTLTESIEQLNRESSRLQLAVERLSSTSRIESIARERLGLDYPVASQMVIVKEPVGNGSQTPARNNPLHSLAKLFGREQE